MIVYLLPFLRSLPVTLSCQIMVPKKPRHFPKKNSSYLPNKAPSTTEVWYNSDRFFPYHLPSLPKSWFSGQMVVSLLEVMFQNQAPFSNQKNMIYGGKKREYQLINHLERKMIFQSSMIMFHVNLPTKRFHGFFSPKALDFLKDCAVVHRDVKPGERSRVWWKMGGAERVAKWSSKINFVNFCLLYHDL